jgi:putative long chain acyl-CoA synthase
VVDLAVSYGLRPGEAADEIPVAAVTLRAGHELTPEMLSTAVSELPRHDRPTLVQVVDEIPVTTWFRPLTTPLRAQGMPPANTGSAWYLDRGGRRYRPLTEAARRRLSAA